MMKDLILCFELVDHRSALNANDGGIWLEF